MKLKSILGAVLAGALALGSTLAYAQAGPIYLTPKLLYSRQNIDSFDSQVSSFRGVPSAGIIGSHYTGGDGSDNIFGAGVAIGYDFGAVGYTPIRAELEFLARGAAKTDFGVRTSGSYLGHPMGTSHSLETKVYTLFANVYYDFVNDSEFTPYIGGGLGGAYAETTAKLDLHVSDWVYPADGTQDEWNFAWNLGAGVAYQISDTMAFDLGYRYSDFGALEIGSRKHHFYTNPVTQEVTNLRFKTKADLSAHEVILGLRISGY